MKQSTRINLHKLLSFFLAVVMMVSLFNVTALAADVDSAEPATENDGQTNEGDLVLVCEKEEHTHSAECYAPAEGAEPVCGEEASEGHHHSEECYGEAVETLTCGLEETEGHRHSEECYGEAVETLVCGFEETEAHTHDESCTETTLTCALEETEGHTHSDECYTEEKVLACGTEETEGHKHSSECRSVICGQEASFDVDDPNYHEHTESCYVYSCDGVEYEAHTHSDECYSVEKVLTCETEEAEAHTHTDECYTTEYTCGLEETEGHAHSEECYEVTAPLACELEEVGAHTHSEECYETTAPLVCEIEESDGHTHTNDCYAEDALVLICETEEHTHTEDCWQATPDEQELPQGDGIATINVGPFHDYTLTDGTYTVDGNIILDKPLTVTGNVTISGSGTIDANGKGSAIIVEGGTLTITGNVTITGGIGTVVNNNLEPGGEYRVGGGIYVKGGTLNLEGGTITGNTAQRGGGIFVNQDAELIMTGGTVSSNSTVDKNPGDKYAGEGGGIFVWGKAYIHKGIISNNTCNSTTDLGGGGLYINNSGIAYLYNTIIKENTAYGFGGGIAGCCHAETALVAVDGVALYENTAMGTSHTMDARGKAGNITDKYIEASDANINDTNSSDFYAAGKVIVSNYMIGGGSAQFDIKEGKNDSRRIQDGEVLTCAGTDSVGTVVALKANPSKESIESVPTDGVLISNNTSKVHGGGVGCNGVLFFGGVSTQNFYILSLNINATKTLAGRALQASEFTFGLYLSGTKIAEAKNDATGNIAFNIKDYAENVVKGWQTGQKVNFTMKEISTSNDTILDKSEYNVPVTFVLESSDLKTETFSHFGSNSGLPEVTINYITHTYKGTTGTITRIVDKNGIRLSNPETVSGGIVFNNAAKGSLSVEKRVDVLPNSAVPDPDAQFVITVKLGEGSTPVEGNVGKNNYVENGLYTFNLKANQTAIINDIPAETKYTVDEPDENIPEGFNNTGTAEPGKIQKGSQAVTITNSYYKQRLIDVTVNKKWAGESGDLVPDSITVQLMKDGEKYENPVELTATGNWTHTWQDLPEYDNPEDEGSAPIEYTVVETAVKYEDTNRDVLDKDDGLFLVVDRSKIAEKPNDISRYQVLGGWRSTTQQPTTEYSNEFNKDSTATLVINNTWLPADDIGIAGFTVRKLDNDTKEPIEGVQFKLTYPDQYELNFTTDSNGEYVISGLTDGEYILSEVSAAEGWKNNINEAYNSFYKFRVVNDKTNLIEVKDANGDPYKWQNSWHGRLDGDVKEAVFTLYNKVNRFNIELSKEVYLDQNLSNDSELLKNVEFSFLVTGTGVNGEKFEYTYHLNQNNNWHVTVQNLPYGTYRIVENGRIPVPYYDYESTGFKVNGEVKDESQGLFSYEFTCNDDHNGAVVEVTATNNYTIKRVGSIEISKDFNMDGYEPGSGNRQLIDNRQYVFTLTGNAQDGTKVNETITIDKDHNFKGSIENIPVGKYELKETGNAVDEYVWSKVVLENNLVTATEDKDTFWLDITGLETGVAVEIKATNYYTVKTGSITVQKDVTLDGSKYGGTDLVKEYFTFHLSGTTLSGEKYEDTIKVHYNDEATFENVPFGTYTITEDIEAAGIPDYDFGGVRFRKDGDDASNDKYYAKADGEIGGIEVTLSETQDNAAVNVKLDVTNEYTRHVGDLEITKIISGNNMDYSSKYDFTVALKVPGDYVELADEYSYTVSAAEEGAEDRSGKIVKLNETYTDPETDEVYAVYGTVSLGNGETAKVSSLPVGVQWHVIEVKENEGYYTNYENQNGTVSKDGPNATAVTNSNSIYTTVNVNKVWNGDNENRRPTSITVQLVRNGEPVEGETKVLNAGNNWSASWKNLTFGSTYDVVEVGSYPGYTASSTGSGRGTTVNITITNTYDQDRDNTVYSVNKVWVTGEGEENRPDSVTVQLMKDGAASGSPAVLSDANGWSYTWTGLDPDSTYTVSEANVPEGYTVSYSQTSARVTAITNTWTGTTEEDHSLTVNKVWEGGDAMTRPTEITVQLYRGDEAIGDAVTLSAAAGWTYTWTGLKGEAEEYWVDELTELADYEPMGSGDGWTYTITNTYNGSPLTPMLSVQKVWVGDDELARPTEIKVEVLKDGQVDETVTLNAQNGWSWSRQITLDEITSTFTVREAEVPAGYTVSVTEGNNGLSFTVYNTYTAPDDDIPDDDIPNDDIPDIEIPESDVPLSEYPTWPWEDIPEDDVPRTGMPYEEIPEDEVPLEEIPDVEVPLTDAVPQTGDTSKMGLWLVLMTVSAIGLAVMAIPEKKRSRK